MRLLETIATHAAAAIHNALAFERTQESALTDNLTGLPNSRFMYSFFDQERSRAERYGYPLVLMMMDLDGFKKINDTYGHHVGDEILRRVAETLRACMRSGDLLIRYAGDEFVALLHRATPEVVADLKEDPEFGKDIVGEPEVPGIERVSGSEVDYLVVVKSRPGRQHAVRRELRRRIKAALEKNGVKAGTPNRMYVMEAPSSTR